MKVLIIKMSSMGDLLHTLPAITDASKAIPNIQFDWVVEEAFTEIPHWHPHVQQVIPIALRRWRKQIFATLQNGEIKNFYQHLRKQTYDVVIDAQASIKSALVTRLALGKRCGMDKYSEHEKFVHLAYQQTYAVARQQHAIDKLRQLFAKTLQYALPNNMPDYGIDLSRLSALPVELPEKYVVFVPNTPWLNKQWPAANWLTLLRQVTATGVQVVLPWGNATEEAHMLHLASAVQNVLVLPRLTLSEIATVLAKAKAVVAVDTGLSHLTAALNVPAITLYNATDPKLIGAISASQIHLQAKAIGNYRKKNVALTSTITTDQVWQVLAPLLTARPHP